MKKAWLTKCQVSLHSSDVIALLRLGAARFPQANVMIPRKHQRKAESWGPSPRPAYRLYAGTTTTRKVMFYIGYAFRGGQR
jgi:hypothetical protein